jgi:hypothetical protein
MAVLMRSSSWGELVRIGHLKHLRKVRQPQRGPDEWNRPRESTSDRIGVTTPTSYGSLSTQSAEPHSVAVGLALMSASQEPKLRIVRQAAALDWC